MARSCGEDPLLGSVRDIAVWVERIFWMLLVVFLADRCSWSCTGEETHGGRRRTLEVEPSGRAAPLWGPADPDPRQKKA